MSHVTRMHASGANQEKFKLRFCFPTIKLEHDLLVSTISAKKKNLNISFWEFLGIVTLELENHVQVSAVLIHILKR